MNSYNWGILNVILFLNKKSKRISEQNSRQTGESPQRILCVWSRTPTQYSENIAGRTLRSIKDSYEYSLHSLNQFYHDFYRPPIRCSRLSSFFKRKNTPAGSNDLPEYHYYHFFFEKGGVIFWNILLMDSQTSPVRCNDSRSGNRPCPNRFCGYMV